MKKRLLSYKRHGRQVEMRSDRQVPCAWHLPNLSRVVSLILVLLLGLSLAHALLSAEGIIQCLPAKISGGPLLFYVQREGSQVHYVLDPEASMTPQPFLMTDTNVTIVHRFDKGLFLLEDVVLLDAGGLFLLDIEKAKITELRPGRKTKLASLEGRLIYFLEQGGTDNSEYGLGVYDLDSCASHIIHDGIENISTIFQDSFLGAKKKRGNELWLVSKHGQYSKKMMDLGNEWYECSPTAALSPDGRLLAVAISNGQTADLEIIDIATVAVVSRINGIPVRVSPISELWPWLEFIWLDDENIRLSETEVIREKTGRDFKGYFRWVDINIYSKKRSNKTRYESAGFSHETPSKDSLKLKKRPIPWEEGLFMIDGGALFFKGEKVPAFNTVNEKGIMESSELEISKDGRWAAAVTPQDGLWLVDGQKKTKKQIIRKWCYSLTWQPKIE